MIRPRQTLFLYFVHEPKRRWCVAGAVDSSAGEREEFRSYGAAKEWAEGYLHDRNGGEIRCHDKEGYHAVTLEVKMPQSTPSEDTGPKLDPSVRARPSELAERRANV